MTDGNYQCGNCNEFFNEPFEGVCPHCGSGNWVRSCVDEPDELTDAQVEQCDTINTAAYQAMCATLGKEELPWDMEWIGEISDKLADIAIRYFGAVEMDVYPFIEGQSKELTQQLEEHFANLPEGAK